MKKIIISRTDSIGDVVLTLPVAGIIREKFPDCNILFLGCSYTRDIVMASEHVNGFIDWNEFSNASPDKLASVLKETNSDAIVHVFPRKEIARAAKKAGITVRIGTGHRLYHLSNCTHRVNFSRKRSKLHEAQLNIKLLAPLGISKEIHNEQLYKYYGLRKPPITTNPLIDPNRFNLILHPKSKGSAREWGPDNFSELIHILPEDKFKIFVTGTTEEGEILDGFLKAHAGRITDMTGKFTLSELINFICACDGLVAASTGPLHIAAAFGKYAVGLFAPMHPIHPGRWAPVGEKASFLVLDKNCKKCRKETDCECIRSIKPVDVYNRLIEARTFISSNITPLPDKSDSDRMPDENMLL